MHLGLYPLSSIHIFKYHFESLGYKSVIHGGLNTILPRGGWASEKAHLTRAGFEPTILVTLTPYCLLKVELILAKIRMRYHNYLSHHQTIMPSHIYRGYIDIRQGFLVSQVTTGIGQKLIGLSKNQDAHFEEYDDFSL